MQWRDQLLDAIVLAGALVATSDGTPRAATRMRLMSLAGRSGLAGAPGRDLRTICDGQLGRLSDLRSTRRVVSKTMMPFVGTPWTRTILDAAAEMAAAGGDPSRAAGQAIAAISLALGVLDEAGCGRCGGTATPD